MTVNEILEFIDKYDKCPKCGKKSIVEVDTIKIKEGYCKCSCSCGWQVEMKE